MIEVAFWAVSLVLAASGAAKLADPEPFTKFVRSFGWSTAGNGVARAVAVIEAALSLAGLAVGGSLVASTIAVAYGVFTVATAVGISRKVESCGCFGAVSVEPTFQHLMVNVVSAAVCAVAAVSAVEPVADWVDGKGLAGATAVVASLVLAALVIFVGTRDLGAMFTGRSTSGGHDERHD